MMTILDGNKLITSLFIFIVHSCTLFCVDPCTDHIETNDTTLTTAYSGEKDNFKCQRFEPFKWHRFTGTPQGYMTNTCPSGFQCGSDIQIWLNDTFPTVVEGETFKSVCANNGLSCCNFKTNLKVKNCSDFLIYFLVPVPACASYCFDAPKQDVHLEQIDSSSSQNLLYLLIALPLVFIAVLIVFVIIRKVWKQKNQVHEAREDDFHSHSNNATN